MANKTKKPAAAPVPKGKKRPPKLLKEKKQKDKGSWRQRFSITTLLLSSVMICILIAGIVAGGYALNIVYRNKLTDTWAILFLELESYGNRLVQKFEQFQDEDSRSFTEQPDVILKVLRGGEFQRVRGDFPEKTPPGALHLRTPKLDSKWTVLQFAGKHYLAFSTSSNSASRLLGRKVSPGPYFLLWNLDIQKWLADSFKEPGSNVLYVVSKQGRLLHTNDKSITQTNYVQKPLVQKFVAAPLRQGQMEFESETGPAYGFFYEVPSTNLIMFVETLRGVALAPVWDLATHFTIVLFFILSVAGVLLQFPLASLIAPIKELVRLAAEIGDGNFEVRPKISGFGELRMLSGSFVDMAKNLTSRDERINMLLVEQQEKFRLSNELSIAQSIQDNFLFKAPLPEESGLEVAAQYTPAAEVAGDWYGYFHNEATGETVFAIADVSGHGAGSAMFTAIIAATFEETRARSVALDTFPMEDFARRLNRLIMKLGHGSHHATMLMAKYKRGEDKVEFLNAGHPFPLIVPPKSAGVNPEPVLMRSDLLGMSLDFLPVVKEVDFPPGYAILMFTDGLIEGAPDHRLYRDKRLAKIAFNGSDKSVKHMIDCVYADWQDYLRGEQATDDVCLLGIRSAA